MVTLLAKPRRPKRLRHVDDARPGIRRVASGTGFRYLADATTWRQIIGIEQTKTERGSTLAILSPSENYEEDEEKNERIECRACLREFPIPAGLKPDFR